MDTASQRVVEGVVVLKAGPLLCRSFAIRIVVPENFNPDAEPGESEEALPCGEIVSWSELTRARDLPAVAIGAAQRILWNQSRTNRLGSPA